MKEKAIEYFKFHRKIFCEDHLKICPKDSIAYQATLKEKEFYDMAIKALQQQPSEDCVDREELKKWLDMNFSFGGALRKIELFDRLDKELPPVTPKGVTITDFADKCRECGVTYGKQLKKLERIKARYAEERGILLNSSLTYTPNNVLDIIDYIMCEDTEVEK